MLEQVEYSDDDGYPSLTFSGDQNYHYVPVQALADRMELYGLESVEQALEYIGLELHNPGLADPLHGPIQEAYGEVATAEYAQSLMPSPRVADRAQTMLAPMSISVSKRDVLRECRGGNLRRLGMKSVVHSEPTARVMDATRPVERTRPAAAEALQASEGAVSQAVSFVQHHLETLQAWRLETVCSYVPQLRAYLEQLAEGS